VIQTIILRKIPAGEKSSRWRDDQQLEAGQVGRLSDFPSVANFSSKRATRFGKMRSIGLPPPLEMQNPLPS